MPDLPNDDSRKGRLDAAIASYLEAVERGETPDTRLYVKRHPDISRELSLFFADRAAFQLAAGKRAPGAPANQPAAAARHPADGTGSKRVSDPSQPTLAYEQGTATPHGEPGVPPRKRVVPRGQQGEQNAPTFPAASAEPERGVPTELAAHGRYRIVRRLGSGGMGDVYLAEHRLMERLVAVKVILPELVSSSTLIERFHREVKAAARLAHPNIVTAHDAEQAGHLHFLTMEYVEGVDLAQVVAKHGALPVLKACHFVRQAALGLQHAFEKGMVHRDIKPQNLMLTPKGQVKILDFGIARFAREKITPTSPSDSDLAAVVPGGTQLTASGSLMGTADYMAPEQAIDARQADTRADIYSLGCTFYYLLTGQVPFPGGTFVDKIMRHAEEHWTSPERLRPEVSHEVVEIVNKMMAKNPARRFQTPAEVAKALERVIRAAPAKPAADAAPVKQGPSRAATSVAKSSTYPVAQQRTPAPIDIAAILQAELPPLPPPERSTRARRQAETKRSNSWRYLIGTGLAVPLVAAAWAIASVFRVGPATGSLEVLSPVAVAVKQGGQTVKLIEPNDATSFELPTGDYQLVLAEARDEFVLSSEQVTVQANVPQCVRVTKKPKETTPCPAVVTEATAKPIGPLPLRVKNLAPTVNIVNVEPEAPEAGGSLTIHLTGFDPEDDPITFEYRMGLNDPWHDAPNGLVALRELGSGPLTVEVRALDSAGNPSEGVTHSVEVKPAAPQTPPLAKAPFSAEQARRHQEAWASHLKCKVEETNSIGMKLALIPPGEFQMGSPPSEAVGWRADDELEHHVRITKPFHIGAYEVTQKQYKEVMGNNPSWFSTGGRGKKQVRNADTKEFPVEQVSWDDAVAFCERLSAFPAERQAGHVYRLPTEAEWEYACRAGTTTLFHFGGNFNGQEANCNRTAGPRNVGAFQANSFGLFDMHGNVFEWCGDWHGKNYYSQSPLADPAGPDAGAVRVVRGGGFDNYALSCRCAARGFPVAGILRYNYGGFRVASSIDLEKPEKTED